MKKQVFILKRHGWVACTVPACANRALSRCAFILRGKRAGEPCDRAMCAEHETLMQPSGTACPGHARLIENEARAAQRA